MSIDPRDSGWQGLPSAAVFLGLAAQHHPSVEPPSTLAADETFDTGLQPSGGFKCLTVAAETSAAATLSVQRYIDRAGTIPRRPASTLTAATLGVLDVADGLPFSSYQVTVTAGAAEVELSNFLILQA